MGMKAVVLDPTPQMIDAGAQRLISFEDETQWPDDFGALQVSSARNLAERVWRSMWCEAHAVPNVKPLEFEKTTTGALRCRRYGYAVKPTFNTGPHAYMLAFAGRVLAQHNDPEELMRLANADHRERVLDALDLEV